MTHLVNLKQRGSLEGRHAGLTHTMFTSNNYCTHACAYILAFTVFPFSSFCMPPSPLFLFPLLTSSFPPSHPLLGCMWICCFICGLQKEKLEDISHGFDQHTMHEGATHGALHVRDGEEWREWPSQCYVFPPSLSASCRFFLIHLIKKHSYSGVAIYFHCASLTHTHRLSLS